MWHDIEAEVDLLNFGVVARAAADLIRQAGGAPLTIGVSGGWGAGKLRVTREFAACFQPHHIDDAEAQRHADAENPGEVPHCSLLDRRSGEAAGEAIRIVGTEKQTCRRTKIVRGGLCG